MVCRFFYVLFNSIHNSNSRGGSVRVAARILATGYTVAVHRSECRQWEVRLEFPSFPKDLLLHVLLVSVKPWYLWISPCIYLLCCSVDTELIRRHDGAQVQFNDLFTTVEMNSLVVPSFCFVIPFFHGHWKHGGMVSENSNIIFSAVLSQIPSSSSEQVPYHFFSDPGPKNDH